MSSLSTVETFEHHGDVVHVNACRSVVDGWTVSATVIGRGDRAADARPALTDVTDLVGLRFSSQEEAVAAGSRIARDYLDRLGS